MIKKAVSCLYDLIDQLPRNSYHKIPKKFFFMFVLRILFYFIIRIPSYIIAIPIVGIIRIISPWYLIRFGYLHDSIGHMAGNTELYLCRKDANVHNAQSVRCVDLFFLEYPLVRSKRGYNKQLFKMWKRVINVFPEYILAPVRRVNSFLPGRDIHEISRSQLWSNRDIYNLFSRYPCHLKFTQDEEDRGKIELMKLGIPYGVPFVCLLVRDSAYYSKYYKVDSTFSGYRDSNIDNYCLAIEELIKRGYYVVRMGVVVNKPIPMQHPHIIDYAWKGLRSDFMDIYLGAKCSFSISTYSGWDAIPYIFRKPMVFANAAIVAELFTFNKNYLSIIKRYRDKKSDKNLKLNDIISSRELLYYSQTVFKENIDIIENTPDEIREVVIEMIERLNNTWSEDPKDKELQERFWSNYPIEVTGSDGRRLHGKNNALIGAHFLRNNKDWLLQ